MTVLKSVELFFQEGTSDKVYNAAIVDEGGGKYTVQVAWGRRGANLNTGTKAVKVSLDKAEKAYDKVIREKTKKGYEPITAEVKPAPVAPPVGEGSGTRAGRGGRERLEQTAQLLNAVDDDKLEKLLADSKIVAQQKFDGMRLLLHVGDEVVGTNRNGEIVAVAKELVNAVADLSPTTILDGELLSAGKKWTYRVFDLLEHESTSLRNERYLVRLERLEALFSEEGPIRVVPTAKTPAEKQQLFEELRAARAEGIVFKKAAAPYMPGRPASGGAQLKYKFIKSADVVITANAGNAYRMAVYDGGALREVGKVFAGTTNSSRKALDARLAAGEQPVAEVEYLYATDTRTLYQPVFHRLRDDKTPEECSIDQLIATDRDVVVDV